MRLQKQMEPTQESTPLKINPNYCRCFALYEEKACEECAPPESFMNTSMKAGWLRLPIVSVLLALGAAMVVSTTTTAQIQQVWTRTSAGNFSGFIGAFSFVALDGQSNICVTGTAQEDFLTVKYSPAGSLIWSNRFDGGSAETAGVLAADALGQVWVSGTSKFTNGTEQRAAMVIKYDAEGSLAWTQRFHSNVLSAALALDSSGNSYIAGALMGGFLYVVKYSPDGHELWARTYSSTPGWFMSFGGVAVDAVADVVLTGLATDLNTFSRRNVLVKFDSAGSLLWSKESLPYLGGGAPTAMAVDQAGNAYVSGNSILAAQVGPNGALNWTRPRSGSLPTFSSVQIDPAGNLVVAGTDTFYRKLCADCGDSATDYYLFRTKLSPSGTILWPERSNKDFGFGYMQFDADGSCYLGGSFSSRSDDALPAHPDSILVKYAPNGSELWRTNFSTGFMAGIKVDGAGDIYLINGPFGLVEIRKFVQPETAPVLRSQPLSRTILDGDELSFSVSGSGFPSPIFQWCFNGTPLPNETNDTLSLNAGHINQAGSYTVMLSNRLGSATSAVATLTVNVAAPTVTAQFTQGGTQALVGASVTLCALATGGPKPALQWRFNGADLPGQTNPCLALGSLQIGQSGTYSVLASNALGTATAVTNLDVIPVTIQLVSSASSLAVGTCIYFSSQVGFTSGYSLQWLLNGQALTNETNPSLQRCLRDTNEAGFYALMVSDSSGSYTSAPVQISVYYAPPANARPTFLSGSAAALVGQNVSLYAAYSGSPSFVQWRFDGLDLPGETNLTLPLFTITTDQAGEYSFVATNIVGATTSTVTTITVSYQPPAFVTQPSSLSVVEGTTARFSTEASGGPPPAYYLERDGTNVAVPFTYPPCCPPLGGFDLIDATFADAGAYRIIASNSLGSATSDVVTLTISAAGPLDRWTQRNPLPQSQSILSVAHGSNQFVAVGDRGTIMTSPDGANWAVQNRRVDLALNGVAYGQGLFVAVGEGGTILSSSDGTNWAYRYTAAFVPLNAVTYGAGRFVAVGTTPGLTTLILNSTNGIDWERIPLNGPSAHQCVTYGNGLFIAGGGSSIIISTNGSNWSVTLNIGTQIESIIYADGRYVAVGDNGVVIVSTDGLSWVGRGSGTTRRLLGVAYGAGRFVAAGARGVMITSTDTVTWSGITSGTPDRMETMDFFDGVFVAAGENGTIITSTNGSSWVKQNFGITRDLDGMAVANGTLVVVGKGGTILTSANGVNYVARNAGLTNDLHGVTWGGGLWVAVGEPGIILTSSNAVQWTSRSSGNTNSLKAGTYAEGQWVVVGTQGTIVRSTDGMNWTTTYTNPSYDLNAIAYGNGLFLVAGDGPYNQNGSLFKSTDGVAWTQVNFSPSKNLRGVTFADGLFLFAANDGLLFTTSNAVTYSSQNVFEGLTRGENLRAVARVNDRWVVVGNDGTIATSPDSTNWIQRASRTFENLHQVAWLDGRFVTIGNRGTILQSGRLEAVLEPPRWVPGVGVRLPFQAVLDRIYHLQASTNLVNWLDVLTFTNQSDRDEFTDPNALQFPQRFYRLREP